MKAPSARSVQLLGCLGVLLLASVAAAGVDKVICVPWHGNPLSHHTAISGAQIKVKGVIKTTDTSMVWYRWVFGDGSPASGVTALSGSTVYNVEANHTYTGAVGTPFTAQLQVDDVDDTMVNAVTDPYLVKIEQSNLDAQVNIAIDNGLWFLFKSKWTNSNTHSYNGQPVYAWSSYSSYYASPTASAVLAFEVNSHLESGDPDEDPYAEAVKRGLNWLLNGYYSSTSYPMLQPYAIGGQTYGDPDTNGNGIGIQVRDYSYSPAYEGGMIMDAIIASKTPDKDTGRDFDGDGNTETYRDVIQDMCDMYAWGQGDDMSGTHSRGGWRYSWNYGDSDNSACQWAAIGMIPAEHETGWECNVPQWMKDQNDYWLNYSYSAANRWFGYTNTGAGNDSSIACRPSGMVQMVMSVADYKSDTRWITCESWFADNFATFISHRTYYGWYAFVKSMRLSNTETLSNGFNWYRGTGGMASKLISDQEADGSWPASGHTTHPGTYGDVFVTAWAIGMLKPALFSAAPIASFTARPNPTYSDYDITFDPSSSGHSEAGKSIENLVLFEWDWDNDSNYDESHDSPVPVVRQFHAEPEELPKTFPVTLRVTDDEGLTATYTLDIVIGNPPHPPVADADGPYLVSLCPTDSLTLDGSGSYDPNEGTHEAGAPQGTPDDTLTAWDWDLTPPLTGFDDESGETVELDGAAVAAYFVASGRHDVGLRVTDNTLLAFPSSGQPNLTDANFSSVMVYDMLDPCVINSEIGCHSVLLTWETQGSFEVWRSTSGKNIGFTKIGEAVDATSYNDYDVVAGGDVVEGTTYWYRLVRPNDTQMSCWTSIEYQFDFTKCQLVDDLNAAAKDQAALLSWTHLPAAQSYNVYRSASPDVQCIPANRIAAGVVTTECLYLDVGLVNGTTYYYKVSAFFDGREQGVSNEADATPVEPPPSEDMTCEAALNVDWVYQNTDTMTGWRHLAVLTITMEDPQGLPGTFYGVTVTADPSSTGAVVIQPTADMYVWNILGSRHGAAPWGDVTLNVTVRTLFGRRSASDTATLTVRRLGDIVENGFVNLVDKVALARDLNGMATASTDRELDLTGDGNKNAQDMAVMNQVLNNFPVP